jgi:hypothetical protein
MARHQFAPLGFIDCAIISSDRTPWVESTTWRWIKWAGHIAFKDDTLSFDFWIRDWDGRHQGLRIRVQRMPKKVMPWGHFGDFAQVHYSDPVRDMFDYS